MNLTKIKYFVEVAKCGNFSEAARRLYTAQPNVSKQIAQMEQELDFALFHRTKRAVQLTSAGRMLYEYMKDLPRELDELFEQAGNVARREEAVLHVGILEGQELNSVLLTRLNLAQELNRNLELELERNSYANLRSGLRNGHYDIIVTLDFDVETEEAFDSVTIFSQPPAIAIHRSHRLASQPHLCMEQLAGENFVVISPQESPVGYERFIAQCQASGFTPNVVRQPRSLESLILCVEMGVGIGLLDQNIRLGHDSPVRTVPLPSGDMRVVAAYLKNDFRPLVRNVVQLLCQGPNGDDS